MSTAEPLDNDPPMTLANELEKFKACARDMLEAVRPFPVAMTTQQVEAEHDGWAVFFRPTDDWWICLRGHGDGKVRFFEDDKGNRTSVDYQLSDVELPVQVRNTIARLRALFPGSGVEEIDSGTGSCTVTARTGTSTDSTV